jgi:putative methyltransferase (TIGR04325 family)
MGIGKTARKYARQLFSDQFYATAKKAYRSVIPAPKLLPPGYYGDHGDFASFAEAATAAASAYDQSIILEKTLAGTEAIRPTDAVPRNDLQLFAALWSAVTEVDHAPVRVLDFGGALGAHFFRFYGSLPKPVIWTVVELPGTVAMAKMALQSDQLRFTESLEEAGPADIVIASGVLQFLPEP